jgi:hypothetical protein
MYDESRETIIVQPPSQSHALSSFHATSSPLLSPVSVVFLRLDDLHEFDPTTMTWTLLSFADDAGRPSARSGHGFTSVGGLLYVHGGYGINGQENGGEAMASLAGDFNEASMCALGQQRIWSDIDFEKFSCSLLLQNFRSTKNIFSFFECKISFKNSFYAQPLYFPFSAIGPK